MRWSKLDAERVQSLEGVLYDLFLVLSVGWSFPASARGVEKGAGEWLGLGSGGVWIKLDITRE